MQFLYPNILYALSLALIPLILHLINLRKHKKMYFSSLWFLKSLKQQTSRSKKIYEWLLLLIRTLLIAALVIAFAGPVLENKHINKKQQLHLILDNTLSMQNSNEHGNLYDQVRSKSLEIINNLDKNQMINIYFLANGKAFYNQSLTEARSIIQKSTHQHGASTINEIVSSIKEKGKNNHVIILSDFQTNILNNDTTFNDTLLRTGLILFKGKNSNISVDSIWFNRPIHIPNEETEISIKLKNHSGKSAEDIPIQVFINNELTSVGTESIEPNGVFTFKTKIQLQNTGFIKIKANIQDLPLNFDNTYYSGFYLHPKFNLLEIADSSSKYLKTLFNEKELFNFITKQPTNVTLSDIHNASTIIINQPKSISSGISAAIQKKVSQGSNLIIIPNLTQSVNKLIEDYEAFNLPQVINIISETTNIKEINIQHPVYNEAIAKIDKNTKFPEIDKFLKIKPNNSQISLINNEFDEAMLVQSKNSNGFIYFFTFNPLAGKFVFDPLFIPTLYNATVITNKSILPQMQCMQSKTITLGSLSDTEQNPIYIGENNNEFIPYYFRKQQNIIVSIRKNQIINPGYYTISQQDSIISLLAANYIKNESLQIFYDEEYLIENIFKNTNSELYSADDKPAAILKPIEKLWKWFILIALVMIAFETIILFLRKRVKKHN